MPSVPLSFFFIALVILLGFLTTRLFQTTRVPDIPLLLSIGLLIGPLNRVFFRNEFLESSFQADTFQAMAPFVSTLALIVILFDSGLKLDFDEFSKGMKPAFLHTIPLFVLTVAAIAAIALYVLGIPTLPAVVLGIALSNVGQTVSASLIREFNISPQVRSIYFVEMATYDLISIPILVSVLEFAKGTAGVEDFGVFFQSLARVMSVSLVLGVAGGLVWLYVLLRMQNYPYTYMVTLASLLLVYSISSFMEGSGAVAVLVFGLVVGNRHGVLRLMRKAVTFETEGERMHTFHDEITFFIRSFFFVFLGITFSTGAANGLVDGLPRFNVHSESWPFSVWNNTGTLFLLGVLLIFAAIVLLRYTLVRYYTARVYPDRMSLWAVYGRGLGTAVLATYPFTLAEFQDTSSSYHAQFAPYQTLFTDIALLIILLTVLSSSFNVMLEERRLQKRAGVTATDVRAAKE